jgi:hypothetical protein
MRHAHRDPILATIIVGSVMGTIDASMVNVALPTIAQYFGFYNVMTAMFEFLNTQNTMDTTAWMQGFAKYRWQGIMGFESSWIGEVGDGINRRI